MKDLYVDDLAEETGKLFQNWAWKNLNMDAMVTQYMCSHLRENIDKRYARFCTQSWNDMDRQFQAVEGTTAYDPLLCDWLGYFYTYLQQHTGKSSRAIIQQYPFEFMYVKSNVLHDLDMDLAIERWVGHEKNNMLP